MTNGAGSVTTGPGLQQITPGTPAPLAPAIAAPPASITVAEGNAANLAVAVTAMGAYSYQRFKAGGQPIANSDSASLRIAAVAAADAGSCSVRVTNPVGQVLSAAATQTVVAGNGVALPPTIMTAPVALAVLPGGGATFAVVVSGTAPFSYQASQLRRHCRRHRHGVAHCCGERVRCRPVHRRGEQRCRRGLCLLALPAAQQGRFEAAAQLMGAADAGHETTARQRYPDAQPAHERTLGLLRAVFDEARLAALRYQGRGLSDVEVAQLGPKRPQMHR